MSQFQPGKWALGFVGVLLVGAALNVVLIVFMEPHFGRWIAAVLIAVVYAIVWCCMAWVQKRYGRPPDR